MDRNFNRTGHENYFWRSTRDYPRKMYARRELKKIIRRFNRRLGRVHIADFNDA